MEYLATIILAFTVIFIDYKYRKEIYFLKEKHLIQCKFNDIAEEQIEALKLRYEMEKCWAIPMGGCSNCPEPKKPTPSVDKLKTDIVKD